MFRDIGNGAEEEDGADISEEDLRSYFRYQFLKSSFIFRDTFKKVDVDNSGAINMQVRNLIDHLMQAIIKKTYEISNFNKHCSSQTRQELKMAVEYLAILYGLDDVSEELKTKRYQHSSQFPPQADAWVELMKEADDGDGSLGYEEFAAMIRKAQKN